MTQHIETPVRGIGIVSPGDMGSAVAARLREAGFAVHAALDGRSERTRALGAAAGMHDYRTLDALVARCQLVLSILDPAAALPTAHALAAAMQRTGHRPLFADCNAVAPQSKREMAAVLEAAGGEFVDAAIIGPPPRGAGRIRLYVSGPRADALRPLAQETIDVRVVSDRIGDAAAVKMCFAAGTKGTTALLTAMLVAAHRLGIHETLDAELAATVPGLREFVHKQLPSMPPKAYRWVPETQEVAATLAAAGLTPRMLEGAAELYAGIAATALGGESPEAARGHARSPEDVIAALAAALAERAK